MPVKAGASYGVKQADGKPRISATPYTYDIAEGLVTGHKNWSKIGFCQSVGTNEVTVAPWCTAPYVFPTTELAMTIVSNSTADSTAGSGARTLMFYYLDKSFVEKSVAINMNATTSQTIATDIYRVQNIRVTSVGASNAAVGAITVAFTGVTYGYISAGRTRQRQCTWTVPAGTTLYVTQIAFSAANQNPAKAGGVRFTTHANFDDKSGTVLQRGLFMPYNEVVLYNTPYMRELNPPTKLAPTTDIKVSAISLVADTADVTCALRGWTET